MVEKSIVNCRETRKIFCKESREARTLSAIEGKVSGVAEILDVRWGGEKDSVSSSGIRRCCSYNFPGWARATAWLGHIQVGSDQLFTV